MWSNVTISWIVFYNKFSQKYFAQINCTNYFSDKLSRNILLLSGMCWDINKNESRIYSGLSRLVSQKNNDIISLWSLGQEINHCCKIAYLIFLEGDCRNCRDRMLQPRRCHRLHVEELCRGLQWLKHIQGLMERGERGKNNKFLCPMFPATSHRSQIRWQYNTGDSPRFWVLIQE